MREADYHAFEPQTDIVIHADLNEKSILVFAPRAVNLLIARSTISLCFVVFAVLPISSGLSFRGVF